MQRSREEISFHQKAAHDYKVFRENAVFRPKELLAEIMIETAAHVATEGFDRKPLPLREPAGFAELPRAFVA